MTTHNAENERIKRSYFTYLAEAQGFNRLSLDAVAKALNRFETYTKFRSFKSFHIQQAKGFKLNLAEQMNTRTGERLSKATLYSTLIALKRFFVWLAGQPGYKSRSSYSDADLSCNSRLGAPILWAQNPVSRKRIPPKPETRFEYRRRLSLPEVLAAVRGAEPSGHNGEYR
jgi:hypothetical protein